MAGRGGANDDAPKAAPGPAGVRCTLLLRVLPHVACFRLTVAPFDVTSTSPNTLRKEHNQQQ